MWAAIINILLGLWLMISPALLQFEKAAFNNNYIVGPLVLTCAVMALWEVNRSARYLNMAAGGWLVASPFILNFQSSQTAYPSNYVLAPIQAIPLHVKYPVQNGHQPGQSSRV